MKFLIDTNIVIPLEPTSGVDLGVNTDLALRFHNLSTKSGNNIYIHPAISFDIRRDKNDDRKTLRKKLIKRYPALPSPPSATLLDSDIIKSAEKGTNDWVDNKLLAALQDNLVDYLVTEDIGIHKKGKRLGIDSRVLLLVDAIDIIQDLFDSSPTPPPAVSNPYVHQLDTTDPVFDSLRSDYGGDNFDAWLEKCKLDHRRAYVVKSDSGRLAGVVILKPEISLPNGQNGKILKICTFKISDLHGGNRLGELLLKPVFNYVKENRYEYAYFTAFPKQTHLISFAHDFGFVQISNLASPGELALCKSFVPGKDDSTCLAPLDFHIRFGPLVTSFNGNGGFVVPIKPEYHQALFPELGASPRGLFSAQMKPCGNSIRKAYLCNSPTRKIAVGDNLFFYRSNDYSALTCIGIVEETLWSQEPSVIARFVGKRTVYSYSEIEKLCQKKVVLAILFRSVLPITPRINLPTLQENGILKSQPQSITKLQESGIKWIRQKIKM